MDAAKSTAKSSPSSRHVRCANSTTVNDMSHRFSRVAPARPCRKTRLEAIRARVVRALVRLKAESNARLN